MKRTLLTLLVFVSAMHAHAQKSPLSLYYDVDIWQLTAEQNKQLRDLLERDVRIISVDAFCDTTASADYNEGLAERRLNAVFSAINRPKDAVAKAYGERMSKDAKKPLQHFRRVDIYYEEASSLVPPPQADPPMENVVETPVQSEIEKFLGSDDEEVIIQLTILFYNVSGQYLPESEPELRALLDFMQDYPKITAHIRGHICCVPNLYWDEISQERAATVGYYLVDHGIDPKRISFKGYGSSEPFRDPELTDEDRKLNRRVDVIFTKGE